MAVGRQLLGLRESRRGLIAALRSGSSSSGAAASAASGTSRTGSFGGASRTPMDASTTEDLQSNMQAEVRACCFLLSSKEGTVVRRISLAGQECKALVHVHAGARFTALCRALHAVPTGHCSMMRTKALLQSLPCAMLSISRLRCVLTFVF